MCVGKRSIKTLTSYEIQELLRYSYLIKIHTQYVDKILCVDFQRVYEKSHEGDFIELSCVNPNYQIH